MRCSRGALGCGSRFTIYKLPEQYAKWPKCPHCGSRETHSAEKERRAEMKRRIMADRLCTCNPYPFPHDKGTLRMCLFHPLAAINPDNQEIDAYQCVLDTPRGYC